MPSWFASPKQRYRVILVGVAICFTLAILIAAWAALVPFFIGLIVAYLLLPVVDFLDHHAPRAMQRKGISRPLAIIVVYALGLALIAGTISSFVPVVVAQAKTLIQMAPNYWVRIQSYLTQDIVDLLAKIPPEIQTTVNANIDRAVTTLTNALQKGLEVTFRTISQTLSFIIGMIIVPFWLFYVLNDEAKAKRAIQSLIPDKAREDVRCIVFIVDELLSAYVRGQLLLCLVVGVMATIVLLILKVDLAILLGTFAGIFEVIPFFGPYLGAIPAVLLALLKRPITALWVAIGFFAIQQIENIFLVPRISGNAVRFHPALVMVIVVIGSEIAGLWGVLLAVPVAAILRDVFRYLYLRTTERGATPEMALENLRADTL